MGRGTKRGASEAYEDQYGGFGSQDREEKFANTGSGFHGGGSGGGASRSRPGVAFQRHVPKFLQPYAHMLGKGAPTGDDDDEEQPAQAVEPEEEQGGGGDGAVGADDAEEEAIHRALLENPEIAAEFGEKYEKKVKAMAEKERGNAAFGEKRFADAVASFGKCIEFDPLNELYFSNRSAAFAALNQYEEARSDAVKVITLKPGWVKGYARLGQALYGLKFYQDARDAYEKALKIEPHDVTLQKGLDKAISMALQNTHAKKHVFTSKHHSGHHLKSESHAAKASCPKTKSFKSKGIALSFDVSDEEGG